MHFQKNKRITDVYFSGSFFYHHINEKKGRKTSVNKCFVKDNKNWYIPSFYTCSKGIVLDICIETKTDDFDAFIKKWDLLNEEKAEALSHKERDNIEKENPLEHKFNAEIIKNKKTVRYCHMQSIAYIPGNTDNKKVARLVNHYKLNDKNCWSFYRFCFPCCTKGKINSLNIKITAENESFTAAEFIAEANDEIKITHPLNGNEYTLKVQSITDEILDLRNSLGGDMLFPENYKIFSFTLFPEIKDNKFRIRDTEISDSPKKRTADSNKYLPDCSASIGIIGGADGPTVLMFGNQKTENTVHTVCSSLHFEKQEKIKWQFDFIEKIKEDKQVSLKEEKNNYGKT